MPRPAAPLPLPALPGGPLCVAYSGGLDSTVLLHRLATLPAARAAGLRAWHVHHGLQSRADDWAVHCERICAALDVPLQVSHVSVTKAGDGPEAAARRARRAAFLDGLRDGEVLALAHHRDDQAETLLLRALRASGPDGLTAMRPMTAFGRGRLWRPLLDLPRAALEAYAAHWRLDWIEDPSNADTDIDRNFLRRRVLPLLRERWPGAGAALARSAALCGETVALLEAQDAQALAGCATVDPRCLSRPRLRALDAARRARVLRRWIAGLGLPPLPAQGIERIEHELLDARPDALARFEWHGARVSAWRDILHAAVARPPLPAGWSATWDGRAPLQLPDGRRWRLEGAPGFDAPLRAHARHGGERIALPGRDHSHALKHVLQDLGVPPWERERLPLLSDPSGDVLAAGDLVYSAGFDAWLRGRDARLAWDACD